jgi:esterase/lipase superfamily enzyme
MELLVFGHAGAPVIVFPTSMGRFYQYEDSGMIDALQDRLENGWIQLYCIDSADSESWYNYDAPPWHRIQRHMVYDRYVTDEVVPFIRSRNSNDFLITTGCSFGGYHAVNYGLRHPEVIRKIIGMSGRYNMHNYLGDFSNDDVYYNVPMDFIGGLGEGDYANHLRGQEINLVVGEWDLPVCMNESIQLSELLYLKNIPNNLDIWGQQEHDWPYWRQQIRKYL